MTKQSTPGDRPRYRISADRQSAYRRVRYVESSHPDDGQCTLCQLDKLAEREQIEQQDPTANSADQKPTDR
ncbi:hypothetical protein SAMN05216198_3014 [Halopseudomonas litoralis]|uniref:Uncharacterized protein n=1 Tax=Halopseudomonas litoralis TaxID=797277 RepID=A0A1H1VSN4_9GAMM|nr:hypothetical protein [Halopseudomonas litoralis]SDS87286.1 hypothetical protein SAMN05216198_3014 [Halopseudomonas litoralis]